MVPATDLPATPFGAPPRPLNEDVLQSAEEAVLTNPDAVETLQDGDPAFVTDLRPGGEGSAGNRLARIVAERPLQSALAALLAGGFLAALAMHTLSRRQR